MGMFDYLRCEVPLPDGTPDLEWQTKDLVCELDTFTIRADGSLWGEAYEIEDRSDPNAEGLLALRGCMTRVNIRPDQWADYTGEVRFYGYVGDINSRSYSHDKHWWEFSAYFANGKLQQLHKIAPTTDGPEGGA